MVEFTMITRFMHQLSNAVTDDRKYTFVANSYTVSLEKDFKIDANGARAFMGHFLCSVETVKRFVNVHLHCNVNNLKNVSNMMMLPSPLEKFLRTSMAIFTLSASFEVWASQATAIHARIENYTKHITNMMTQPFLNILLFTTQLLK